MSGGVFIVCDKIISISVSEPLQPIYFKILILSEECFAMEHSSTSRKEREKRIKTDNEELLWKNFTSKSV